MKTLTSFLDTDHVSPREFKCKFKDYTENSFSVLHLNIRSLSRNFGSFKYLTISELNLISLKLSFLHKRIINEPLIKAFKSRLHEVSCEIINSIKDPSESYKKFIAIPTSIYADFFPKNWIKVRHNKNSTPWLTRSIAKSRGKQKLYEKFLKNCY